VSEQGLLLAVSSVVKVNVFESWRVTEPVCVAELVPREVTVPVREPVAEIGMVADLDEVAETARLDVIVLVLEAVTATVIDFDVVSVTVRSDVMVFDVESEVVVLARSVSDIVHERDDDHV